MKNYKSYMDRVNVSSEFHEKLLDLEAPAKPRRTVWQKYGALAACAALLIGVGAYGASRLSCGQDLPADFSPDAVSSEALVETADIALEGPDEDPDAEPGMKTIPGFEVVSGAGPSAIVNYYVLPWIDYGSKDAVTAGSQIAADYAPPEGSTWRELTRDDILALVGGNEALGTLLDWDGFEFTGSATFNADGTVWQLGFSGERDDFYFDLELAPNALPLTCIMTERLTTTEIWGVEVTGRYSGIHGAGPDREVWMPESREVEFIANGVGCRFTLYGLEGESEAVETMVARFVRHAILEGLDLSVLTADGSVPVPGSSTADPDFSVGEPNWNDSEAAPSVPPSQSTPEETPASE